jgi:hypothetical protein
MKLMPYPKDGGNRFHQKFDSYPPRLHMILNLILTMKICE